MLRTTTTSSSPEGSPEAHGKTRQEVENANGNGAKIGGVKLAKAKNPTKAKNSKATLLGDDPEAKPFLTPEARLALTQLRQAFTEARSAISALRLVLPGML